MYLVLEFNAFESEPRRIKFYSNLSLQLLITLKLTLHLPTLTFLHGC